MKISREQRFEIINEFFEKLLGNSDRMLVSYTKETNIRVSFDAVYPKKKTYKEDFMEKFPNAVMSDENAPQACIRSVYGKSYECITMCKKCWNQEMEA